MDVVVDNDRIPAVIDEAVNALQTAILLATRVETGQRDLRRAIDGAAQLPLFRFDLRGQQDGGLKSVDSLIDRRRDPVGLHDHIHRSVGGRSPVRSTGRVQVCEEPQARAIRWRMLRMTPFATCLVPVPRGDSDKHEEIAIY